MHVFDLISCQYAICFYALKFVIFIFFVFFFIIESEHFQITIEKIASLSSSKIIQARFIIYKYIVKLTKDGTHGYKFVVACLSSLLKF